jgi:NAD-dependent deacetylase
MTPRDRVARCLADGENILFVTGAGISAESGIPTFRGPEGYWTVGSKVYQPMELATRRAFIEMPDDVWSWYLHRLAVCRDAKPNAAHLALVELERAFGDRFCLITQNVDGLHLRAGQSRERTLEIHGNIDFMRCADDCSTDLYPLDQKNLTCPACKGRARPHVLWFDEYYDEPRFRFDSSLRAAAEADVVVTIGSSGATNLPNQVVQIAAQSGAYLIDINPEDNPFAEHALAHGGAWIRETAVQAVPKLGNACE